MTNLKRTLNNGTRRTKKSNASSGSSNSKDTLLSRSSKKDDQRRSSQKRSSYRLNQSDNSTLSGGQKPIFLMPGNFEKLSPPIRCLKSKKEQAKKTD